VSEELRRNRPLLDLLGGLLSNAGALGGLANLGDVVAIGQELFADLQAFSAIDSPWATREGLQGRLRVFVKLARFFTARTPSGEDDALVANVATYIDNDGVMDLVAGVLARYKSWVGTGTATVGSFTQFLEADETKQSLTEFANDNQLNVSALMQIFQLIMQLLPLLKGLIPAGQAGTTPSNDTVLDF